MFGIGLPEMIVIFAVALIVVGPDKLPGMARSLANGLMDLKKTLHQVKDELTTEAEPLHLAHNELRESALEFREKMLNADAPSSETTTAEAVIDLEPEARAIAAELRDEEQDASISFPPEISTTLTDTESLSPAGPSDQQSTPSQTNPQ